MKIHHLYRCFNAEGRLLYVGISLSAAQRLSNHRSGSEWFHLVTKISLETYPSREESLSAERKAVENEQPKHNVKLQRITPPDLSLVPDVIMPLIAEDIVIKATGIDGYRLSMARLGGQPLIPYLRLGKRMIRYRPRDVREYIISRHKEYHGL